MIFKFVILHDDLRKSNRCLFADTLQRVRLSNLSIDYPIAAAQNGLFVNNSAARVGINTNSPTHSFTVSGTAKITGAVQLSNYGAGAVQSDANGNLSVSSDERLKEIVGDFDRGLSAILALKPIHYRWNERSGLEQQQTYSGFSAQNVQSVIPEAVGQDQNGYLTLSDRPIIATLVNAIKAQQQQIDSLKALVQQLLAEQEKD